jgi:succinate dehydrogenase / fumarate reductase, membrane anchor subunit
MASYRTPLSRARGLGAAHHGVGHWIGERISAVALIPLTLWALWAFVKLARGDHAEAVAFVRDNPLNPVLLVLFAGISFWHMHAGMRVVVEDYLQKVSTKTALLLLNLFICVLVGGLTVFSILKVALGAD